MEAKKRMGRDLTTGSVPKGLIAFATPLFLSNMLQAVYNMVDMVVVGKYVGSVGLSAVSIGGDILNMLTFVAMGFSNAGQIIISQYTGAGRKDKVTKLIGTMFTFLLICAVTIMTLGMVFHSTIIDGVPQHHHRSAQYTARGGCRCNLLCYGLPQRSDLYLWL